MLMQVSLAHRLVCRAVITHALLTYCPNAMPRTPDEHRTRSDLPVPSNVDLEFIIIEARPSSSSSSNSPGSARGVGSACGLQECEYLEGPGRRLRALGWEETPGKVHCRGRVGLSKDCGQ